MAVLQMRHITIYALKKDRKPVLELLQRRGVIEINDLLPEDSVFHKMDITNAKVGFEKNINAARDAVEILDQRVPVKKSLLAMISGRKEVSVQEYDAFREKYEPAVKTANRVLACNKLIAEQKAEILKLKAQAETLALWTALDIPLNFIGTKTTGGFIGSFPGQVSLDAVYALLAGYGPVNVDIVSSSKELTCVFVLCNKKKADAVHEALRSADFSYPGISCEKAPREQLEEIKRLIGEAGAAIDRAEQEIAGLASSREELKFLQDYDRMRLDKYEVIGHLSQSKNVFLLSGYIAECDGPKLEAELTERFDLAVELKAPRKKEKVPVKLKNNGFAAPLEWVVESFSLPAKGEIDPTMIMAVFYYLLFGIIMADAGYGALIVLVCGGLLLKGHKTMEAFTKNFLTMFLYCGISTVFWGIAFGSYFGDLIDVVAVEYFGAADTPLIPPLWFFPINKPMKMLTFSMALGIVHLLTGLVMKAYQSFRQKDYMAILYDSVSWFVLVLSCTVALLSTDMMKSILEISLVIPGNLVKASGIAAVLCSVIIIATNGRESRNPFKRFLKGAYALYGISGYLGDVLSYSRLLALGLAASVISSVVNKMAAMAASGIAGPLIFLVIILFGHTLNFAISILGAYVHTNRLQYVEFFGKFYGGGGNAFHPFAMNTKYYKIKESMNNEI